MTQFNVGDIVKIRYLVGYDIHFNIRVGDIGIVSDIEDGAALVFFPRINNTVWMYDTQLILISDIPLPSTAIDILSV